MTRTLSSLVNNLAEEIHEIKCKYGGDNKNAKHIQLNTKILNTALNIQTLKII